MPANEWIYWIVKDEKKVFFDKSQSCFRTNIWRMNAEKNPHPAPYPLLLASNIVKCCSKKGDIVYDPFMGSGTTALAAIDQQRMYIGSEISEKYIDMAKQRIYNETMQLKLFDL